MYDLLDTTRGGMNMYVKDVCGSVKRGLSRWQKRPNKIHERCMKYDIEPQCIFEAAVWAPN